MENDLADIPQRSADGKAALDIFYTEFNEVNFYVEDEDQENLFEIIIKRIFPEIQLCRIFPLSGKLSVLAHSSDSTNDRINAKRIYILDKDFDDFLGRMTQDSRVFYLDRYCIENYLVEESPIVDVVIETHPRMKAESIVGSLNLTATINDCAASLKSLFVLFYCAQRFELGIRNCDTKPEEFCAPKELWKLRTDRFENYHQKIVQAAQELNVQPPLIDALNDDRTAPLRLTDAHGVVSGKFLLAMLFHYIKAKFGLGSTTFDSFRFRVAKNSDLRSLRPFADKIRTTL